MNRSERREYRIQKKKLKQRRKESARLEKESVRRQKREFKEQRRRNRRNKSFLVSLFSYLNAFKRTSTKSVSSGRPSRNAKRERKRALKEEKLSLKREKSKMQKATAAMRRRIREQRIKGFIQSLVNFFKHPIKRKKATKQQLFLKRQIKLDSRKETKRKITNYPSHVLNRSKRFWTWHLNNLKSFVATVAGFLKLLSSVFKLKEIRKSYFYTFLNSTVLFILAFLSVYYLNQLITIYTAKLFDIPAVLFSYRIYWPLYTYSSLYSRMALILIFGTGPLINLILGFVFYRMYILTRWKTAFFKTFFIWASIHSFTMFFGAYIVGVITRTGFIYSSEWLFLSNVFDVEEILFLIISIIVMVIIGYYSTRHFILSSNSSNIIEPKLRVVYMISKVLLPWLLGNGVLFLHSYPNNPFELNLLLWVSILVIVPVFTNYNSTTMKMLKLQKTGFKMRIGWFFVIVLIIVLALIRFFIYKGISFS